MNGSGRQRTDWTALAVTLALAGSAAPSAAMTQDSTDERRVTITGRVVDALTRAPLPGVAVEIAEFGLDLRTDSAGEFRIRRIPLGTYDLALSLEGYRRSSGNFAVVRSGSFVAALTPLGMDGGASPGRFVGRIVEAGSGRPMNDAEVRLPALSMGAATGADGRFAISDVPPGRHPVEFSHLGYATVRDTVTVVAERTSDARVRLAVDPIDMEPIEVTVERREIALETAGFYERRDEGWGRFIDIETIERRSPSETTDLFSGLRGVTLVGDCANPLERYVLLRGGRGGGGCYPSPGLCFPMVVVDGLIVHQPDTVPARIDHLVNSSAIAGIEVYPSQTGVPLQYAGTGSSCGVILFWTRR